MYTVHNNVVRRICAVLLLGMWLSLLPQSAFAEKTDWKDSTYDFSRVRRIMVADVDLSKASFDSEMLRRKYQDEYRQYAQKLGCEIIPRNQLWLRISLALNVDLDAMAKTDPDKAEALFRENLPKYVDAWVNGRITAWDNSYYIRPERTVWEQKRMERTVRDSQGRWYTETYYVTVPYTYPAYRVDVSTLNMSFEVYDAKTGNLIYGREDKRDRDDYNAQDGMFERICKSFFDDFGNKLH